MEENTYNNEFVFSLYQEDVLLGSKCIDSGMFHPLTRKNIDIREVLPYSIVRFQKVLSKDDYEYETEYSLGNGKSINFLGFVNREINKYNKNIRHTFKYRPKIAKHYIDDKIISGVECKIGLYINENPIVERIFHVNNFNPIVRYSTDVLDVLNDVFEDIIECIKKSDERNMWDDYDLINKRGLTINQIRDLPIRKRQNMLKYL